MTKFIPKVTSIINSRVGQEQQEQGVQHFTNDDAHETFTTTQVQAQEASLEDIF